MGCFDRNFSTRTALSRLLLILKKNLWSVMFHILKNNNILLLTLFYKMNNSRDKLSGSFDLWQSMFFACWTVEYILALSSRNLSVFLTGFYQNILFWLTVQMILFYLSVKIIVPVSYMHCPSTFLKVILELICYRTNAKWRKNESNTTRLDGFLMSEAAKK